MNARLVKRIVGLALIAGACSDPTGLSSNLDFAVVREMPTQDPNVATIEFVLTNRGHAALYLQRCGDNVLTEIEQRLNGKWVNASGGICPAINPMDAIRLKPAMQLTGMRQVVGSGQFRLRAVVSPNQSFERLQPAYSTPFTID